MKKYQMRYSSGRAILFSFCVWGSVVGLFSCDSDRLNDGGSIGMLSLNLSTDTANIKGGVLSTKAGNVLEGFEDVDEYLIQIFQENDTLKSALYKDFPEELEVKEGAYTLRASKGENLPAAFDNPYFEGSTDFVIKKEMRTPLEVTCRMANARVYVEYADDFLKAYSDYSVSMKTSLMDAAFSIPKGETRGAYLQVAKEGTPLSIAISLMRESWKEPKVYTVTNPSITVNPKESITLKFATDGKTGDGLNLSIELDDSMEEADLEFGIPDFMYKPFDTMSIWGCGFENGVAKEMNVTDGYQSDSCTIKAEVPGRIKECWVVRTLDGEKLDSVDMATAEGFETATNEWGITSRVNPISNKKGIELDLKTAFNKMEAAGKEETRGFSVYINDALNVMHTSETVTASVKLAAAQEPELGMFEISVPSQQAKDTAIYIMAEAGFELLNLTINKDGMTESYDLLEQNTPVEGLVYDATKHKLLFEKEYTQSLVSKEQDEYIYTYTLKIKDKLGKEKTTVSKFIMTPIFTIVVPEADIWATKATFKIKENITYPVKYQVLKNSQWIDVDGATAKGLTPGENKVRALVSEKEWPTNVTEFMTEEAVQIPNGNMEDWTDWIQSLVNGADVLSDKVNVVASQPNDDYWTTVNQKTFGSKPNIESSFNLVPSTLKTTGRSGNGALVRTVGWDNKSGNAFDEWIGGFIPSPAVCYHVAAGRLFIGSYDYKHENGPDEYNYGKPFKSRPTYISFWNKYIPVKNDKYKAWAILENRVGETVTVLARAEIVGGAVSTYTQQKMKFEYANTSLKATHLTIVFSSSSLCNDNEKEETKALKGGKTGNAIKNTWYLQKITSSPKHYEGSNLYIDDIELIYE